MNENQNVNPSESENKYSTLSAPQERKPRRKKSKFKSQLIMLIIIGVVIAILGTGVGLAVWYFADTDGIVDTFSESKTDKVNGKQTYTYQSRKNGEGFVITDTEGVALQSFFVDANGNILQSAETGATLVYETEIGSLLRLTNSGNITYFAQVDYNGAYIGGETDCRVLVFPHVLQEEVASIYIRHPDEDGKIVEFTVFGKDSDGDGAVESFGIKGYERSNINQLMSAAMCSFAGYTLTLKKLSLETMAALDAAKADDPDYTPLVNADGSINYAEYGLEPGENASYYELTTTGGNKFRMYFGNLCPDGTGYYVRYYDETEGDRSAVYKISDDPGVSTAIGVELSRTSLFLGQPENLVYPQIIYPASMTTYLMADDFVIYKADSEAASGYSKVVDFSYQDLAERNFTLLQTHPYVKNDATLLPGYSFNDTTADSALQDLYQISSLLSSDYTQTAVKNYVTVKKLVKDVLSGVTLPEFGAASGWTDYNAWYAECVRLQMEAIDTEYTQIAAVLAEYGLSAPAYKLSYNTSEYTGSAVLLPSALNYVWISEKTEKNTYYVWAPMYQQILEIGDQYLDMFETDEYDWVSDSMFDTSIQYTDSIRVTGTDSEGNYSDLLFEVDSSYTVSWSTSYLASYVTNTTSSSFSVSVEVGVDGTKRLSLNPSISYPASYIDENGETQTSTEKYSPEVKFINAVNLDTVKNYARYALDNSYINNLSEEAYASLETYSKYVYKTTASNGKVNIIHRIADSGDKYGYLQQYSQTEGLIKTTYFLVTFSYDISTGYISVEAHQEGQSDRPVVFEEKIFDDYFKYRIRNDGVIPSLTESELANVNSFYRLITSFTTVQKTLRVTSYDKTGAVISTNFYEYDSKDETAVGSLYITAFKKFYQTMLYTSFAGRVTESDTATGKVLTDDDMDAYIAKGDDCDLRIQVKLNLDNIEYTYRIHHYTPAKSYITLGNNGVFYINRTRAAKLLGDAIKASKGDTSITGDSTY